MSTNADKTNVNSDPVYMGRIMVLSDQDVTYLKHHVLSSAVIGTVFAGLISIISNPEIPLLYRALLMGTTLTSMQAILVGVSNVGISCMELWTRAGKPWPFKWCGRCCKRALLACWNAYVNGHIVTLPNGRRVWIDALYSVPLDDEDESL